MKERSRSSFGKREKSILLAVMLLGAALRVAFCFYVVGFHAPLRGDEIDYHAIAVSISSGKGFSNELGQATASRPPLWSGILAAFYLISPSPETGRILALLLSICAVALTYFAARTIFSESKIVAPLSAALVAVDPALGFLSGYVLSENLYILFVLLVAIIFGSGLSSEYSWKRFLFGGLVVGLGSLARPTLALFGIFFAFSYFLGGSGTIRLRLTRVSLLCFGILIVLAPWTIRNASKLGSPVIFSTHGGITFYQGNNEIVRDEPAYRGGVAPLASLPGWNEIISNDGEIERDREAWRLGLQFVANNFGSLPRMVLWKFVRFWRLRADMGISGIRSGWWWDRGRALGRIASSFDAIFIYAIVALPLFVAGAVISIREWKCLATIHSIILMHVAATLVFYGSLRSRTPIEPFIAMFSAFAVERIWLIAERKRSVFID